MREGKFHQPEGQGSLCKLMEMREVCIVSVDLSELPLGIVPINYGRVEFHSGCKNSKHISAISELLR